MLYPELHNLPDLRLHVSMDAAQHLSLELLLDVSKLLILLVGKKLGNPQLIIIIKKTKPSELVGGPPKVNLSGL